MTLRDGVYWLDGAPVDAIYLGDEEVYRAILVDNFDARDTTGTKWTYSADLDYGDLGTLVTDGMARFVPDPDPVNGGVDLYFRSLMGKDRPVADTMATWEVFPPPAGTGPAYCDLYVHFGARTVDTGANAGTWWTSLDYEQSLSSPDGSLTHYGRLDGPSGGMLKEMPFDREMMRWLRLRFTGGAVHSEYSPDGVDWTLFHSAPWGGEAWPAYRVMLTVTADPGVPEAALDNFSWVAL